MQHVFIPWSFFGVFVCLCDIVLAFNTSLDLTWMEYKASYDRSYLKHGVEERRRQIWEDNYAFIDKHNNEAEQGLHSYKLSMNDFGDRTSHEYHSAVTGSGGVYECPEYKPSNRKLPNHVDWRDRGYVTDVREQGDCGSCWAQVTVGALEAQIHKKTGYITQLSVQNLVDCMNNSTDGCGGGWVQNAYEYIINNGGIDSEASYPYTGINGMCKYSEPSRAATMVDCRSIKHQSTQDLMDAVANHGPVAVGVHSRLRSFQFYSSGIYDDRACANDRFDHYILVIGYGTMGGRDYWIAKNSWGTEWGEDGYMRLLRNKDNLCSVTSYATFPIV